MPPLRVAAVAAWLSLAHVAAAAGPATGTADSVRTTTHALAALRQGGHVIVMAHGPAALDEADIDTPALDDCAAQRSLTDTGRLMASGVGKFLARERVPVGVVLSSRYCRGIETAERIAQHTHAAKVRRLDELSDVETRTAPLDRARRTTALRGLAAAAPTNGTNTIVVTHRSNIAEAFGPDLAPIGDGELFVLRPSRDTEGRPSFRMTHRVKIADLSAYAKASQR